MKEDKFRAQGQVIQADFGEENPGRWRSSSLPAAEAQGHQRFWGADGLSLLAEGDGVVGVGGLKGQEPPVRERSSQLERA